MATYSKTGKMLYFNGKAFQKGSGFNSSHFDVLSGEQYWISGIKKDELDRHWAGFGKIHIDKNVVEQYLETTKQSTLPKNKFKVVELNNIPPKEEIREVKNSKLIS